MLLFCTNFFTLRVIRFLEMEMASCYNSILNLKSVYLNLEEMKLSRYGAHTNGLGYPSLSLSLLSVTPYDY